jgi:hypothetical protein
MLSHLDGASLCQAVWSPLVRWGVAGPVSDLSEVPVMGCEPAALDVGVAPLVSRRGRPYQGARVTHELSVDDVG